jgi:rod shape-determining protein MreD
VLVVIVHFAFKSLYYEAGILGFASGLLQEGLSGCAMGVNAFSKTVVALLIILVKKLYPARCIPIGISIFLATCVNELLIFILSSCLFATTIDILILVKRVIIEGFYNFFIGIILFPFLSKLKWRGEK